ncbi:MAG: hypothetical protein V9H26_01310 [Verrucomicrobiota bacterium]
MRTKTTLAAAAILAAGLVSSMAQANVYSLNVVGYVNVTVEGGGAYNLLANPLNNTAGNDLNTLFSGPQANTSQVLTWDTDLFDFSAVQPSYAAGAWSANVPLPVGKGFFYVNQGTTFTQTFVGEVVQGSFTNVVTGSGAYNLIGASVPEGGNFTAAITGLSPANTDQVLKWDVNTFDFATVQPSYAAGAWSPATLTINPAEGFFYVRQGPTVNWVRNFTVAP